MASSYKAAGDTEILMHVMSYTASLLLDCSLSALIWYSMGRKSSAFGAVLFQELCHLRTLHFSSFIQAYFSFVGYLQNLLKLLMPLILLYKGVLFFCEPKLTRMTSYCNHWMLTNMIWTHVARWVHRAHTSIFRAPLLFLSVLTVYWQNDN